MKRSAANTYLGPSDDSGFEHHFRLGTKVLELPQHEISQHSDSDLPYQMTDAVRNGAESGV